MPQIRIEHRLGVAAPADVIWGVISDLGRWGEWNPTYAKASGRLAIGAPVSFDAKFAGMKPVHTEGTIVDWVPDAQLLWKVRLGMFTRSLRYIEIEKVGDGVGCIFANGELIEGFGARYISRSQRHASYRGYEAMNEAVKARAEQMWRAGGRAPT